MSTLTPPMDTFHPFFWQKFIDIILGPIWWDLDNQNWSWGHLKKMTFFPPDPLPMLLDTLLDLQWVQLGCLALSYCNQYCVGLEVGLCGLLLSHHQLACRKLGRRLLLEYLVTFRPIDCRGICKGCGNLFRRHGDAFGWWRPGHCAGSLSIDVSLVSVKKSNVGGKLHKLDLWAYWSATWECAVTGKESKWLRGSAMRYGLGILTCFTSMRSKWPRAQAEWHRLLSSVTLWGWLLSSVSNSNKDLNTNQYPLFTIQHVINSILLHRLVPQTQRHN